MKRSSLFTTILGVIALFSFCIMLLTFTYVPQQQSSVSLVKDKANALAILDEKYSEIKSYVRIIENEIEKLSNQKTEIKEPSQEFVIDNSLDFSSNHTISPISLAIDPQFLQWRKRFTDKLTCKEAKSIAIYHYHMRKAAGTTIRDAIKQSTLKTDYMETEGMVLRSEYLDIPHLLTVTSFREPISRIISLYWYEHVGWFHGILGQTEKCSTLSQWVDAWSHKSEFRRKISKQYAYSNYVEIENYYTKALIGWKADENKPITEEDFEKAKETLLKFDIVLISEWLGDETEITAMNTLFPGRVSISAGHKVTNNHKMIEKLTSKLAADEEEVKKKLTEMNKWDLKLYDFAQSLIALRLKYTIKIAREVKRLKVPRPPTPITCTLYHSTFKGFKMKNQGYFGVFRPNGHKGPDPAS